MSGPLRGLRPFPSPSLKLLNFNQEHINFKLKFFHTVCYATENFKFPTRILFVFHWLCIITAIIKLNIFLTRPNQTLRKTRLSMTVRNKNILRINEVLNLNRSQPAFTCLNSTMETP